MTAALPKILGGFRGREKGKRRMGGEGRRWETERGKVEKGKKERRGGS